MSDRQKFLVQQDSSTDEQGTEDRGLKIMYLVASPQALLDHRNPPIIEVEAFKHDEKEWVVPQLNCILFEGHEIFKTYDEARDHQISVIKSMILKLNKRIDDLLNSYYN
jgi:hypothetical protein